MNEVIPICEKCGRQMKEADKGIYICRRCNTVKLPVDKENEGKEILKQKKEFMKTLDDYYERKIVIMLKKYSRPYKTRHKGLIHGLDFEYLQSITEIKNLDEPLLNLHDIGLIEIHRGVHMKMGRKRLTIISPTPRCQKVIKNEHTR